MFVIKIPQLVFIAISFHPSDKFFSGELCDFLCVAFVFVLELDLENFCLLT